jgi:hypothetical protein
MALDDGQMKQISATLDAYHAAEARRQAVWTHAADVFNAPQRSYVAAHQAQVDNKAQELLTLRTDDSRLVDMLNDFTHEGHPHP